MKSGFLSSKPWDAEMFIRILGPASTAFPLAIKARRYFTSGDIVPSNSDLIGEKSAFRNISFIEI